MNWNRFTRIRNRLAPCGIPLAWRQISSDRKRLAVALAGVSFGVMLMLFQLGIYKAFMVMVVRPIQALDGELVVVSRNFEYLYSSRRFPERRIYQALADPAVVTASPLALGFMSWRNPRTSIDHQMAVFGIHPGRNPFRLPEIVAQKEVCASPEGLLFDEKSRPEFGLDPGRFRKDGAFFGEINRRRVQMQGLFAMGPTLAASAHAVTGMETFLRISGLPQHECTLGVLKLLPLADPLQAAARLNRLLPADVEVLPCGELERRERAYWARRTPVGFITLAGMLIAMVVGAVIVYQILYTDINDHMREYATLKALGLPGGFFLGLVIREAAILLAIGFVPGMAIADGFFRVANKVAAIPTRLTWVDTVTVACLAAVMCLTAGLLATRRLRSADPADIFN